MERFMYTKGGESLFITPSHIRHDCHTLIMHYYTTLYYFEKSFTQCKMEFRKLLLSSTLLSAKALISIAKQLIWGVQGEGPEKRTFFHCQGNKTDDLNMEDVLYFPIRQFATQSHG